MPWNTPDGGLSECSDDVAAFPTSAGPTIIIYNMPKAFRGCPGVGIGVDREPLKWRELPSVFIY